MTKKTSLPSGSTAPSKQNRQGTKWVKVADFDMTNIQNWDQKKKDEFAKFQKELAEHLHED